MPVDFNCPHCQRTLRVPDETAGKQAECPSCGEIVDVPDVHEPRWHVRAPDGESFGPVTKTELDHWVAEGRLAADFRVKGEHEADWQSAVRMFPSLLGETTLTAASMHASPVTENPYTSPSSAGDAPLRVPNQKDHRGGLILTLAILGLVCTCFPLGIAAWVMGSSDLAEMRSGRMDRSGEGITRVGQILGIVEVVVFVLGLLGNIGFRLINV